MKYTPLKSFLSQQTAAEVPMTFAEIEQTIGQRLPPSAAKYPAWWSNNPSNNVMTKAWLEAGFRTACVDLGSQRLIFRRSASWKPPQAGRPASLRNNSLNDVYGAMRGTVRLLPGVDLAEPTGEMWGSDSDL